MTKHESAPDPINDPGDVHPGPPAPDYTDVFAKICLMSTGIEIESADIDDREKIARTAVPFIRTSAELGFSATHTALNASVTGPVIARPPFFYLHNPKLQANLGKFYQDNDIRTTDRVIFKQQRDKENVYLKLAEEYRATYPEIRHAHLLFRSLKNRNYTEAANSILDVIVAMGMTLEPTHRRRVQLDKVPDAPMRYGHKT